MPAIIGRIIQIPVSIAKFLLLGLGTTSSGGYLIGSCRITPTLSGRIE